MERLQLQRGLWIGVPDKPDDLHRPKTDTDKWPLTISIWQSCRLVEHLAVASVSPVAGIGWRTSPRSGKSSEIRPKTNGTRRNERHRGEIRYFQVGIT